MSGKRKILLTAALVCALVMVCGCFGIRTFAAEEHTADNVAITEGTNSRPGNWEDYVLGERTAWFNSTAAGKTKTEITKVVFSNTVPTGYTASWDASKNNSNKVIAYLVGTEVTIVGNGGQIILLDCSYMFGGFSQLVSAGGFGILDMADASDMSYMFYKCSSLSNLDLSGFATGNVTDMNAMFYNCSKLSSLDVSNWKTGNVTDMNAMFYNCSSLSNLDLSSFATGNVTDMGLMFYGCSGLTDLDISGFAMGNVTDMGWMFYGCSGLTDLDVSGWNTGNATDMGSMFYNCTGLTDLDVSGWNTGNATDTSSMFYNCIGLSELDVNGWNTGKVTDMGSMFYNCIGLTDLDVSGFDTGNVTDMEWMFCGCSGLTELDVSGFDTGNVTDMGWMFCRCSGLTDLDVSGFDTGNVTDMRWMFYDCNGLTELDVSGFATGNVTDMGSMFYNCTHLSELDVSRFDTGKVTNIGSMFYNCIGLMDLDVSGWNTGNVINMSYLFYTCASLSELDVSNWNTGNATDMQYMLCGCSGLGALDVSGFDTGKVTSMRGMFYYCTGLSELDVSNWNTGNVTNMSYMFSDCSGLGTLDVSNWNTGNVTDMSRMFYNCTALKTIKSGESFIIASSTGTNDFYNGNNLFGGNGKKYTSLSGETVKQVTVGDCHETPGFLTYNGTDKCVVTYDLNYEGASAVEFTQQVKQGKSVTAGGAAGQVPNPARTGYEFLGWGTAPNAPVVYSTGDGVPTDSGSMTLYAQWKPAEYVITIDWQDGEGTRPNTQTTMNVTYGKTPEAITVAVERDKYTFRGIYSETNGLGKLYVNSDGTWYRAWDGTEDTTLYAFWSRKDRDDYFWDVLRTDWFYEDVYFMYDRGLMLGIGNSTTFGPGESLTRSQFVTILYRMAHSPEGVEYEDRFPDVPEGEWFATPVLWAYKNGIVNGYSTGYFGPADAITREQLAVMLYNYVSWKGGFDMTGRADLSGFEDADKVSDWAYDAVSWAVAEGIISGKGGTRLDPQGFTARCECSAMVQRYCDEAK